MVLPYFIGILTVGYGYLRLEYLKKHKKADYIIIFMDGSLRNHIVETDKQAKERFKILMIQMLDRNPINDKEDIKIDVNIYLNLI